MIKKILILLIAVAPSLCAKIEFAGVFYLGDEGNFSLIDSESDRRSGWLQIGQSFQGYVIDSYDRTTEVLQLVSSEERLELRLRPSVVKSERIIIRGNIRIGDETEIAIDNALVVLGEEAKFPIDENTWMRLNVRRVQRGLPPGAGPVIVAGPAAPDSQALSPRPEGVAGGPLYEYTMNFEEINEAGDTVSLAAPRMTTLPGQGFTMQQDKYSFTYEP